MPNESETPEKMKLSPYEYMTLIGATEPCLSERLKDALDEEREKPKYDGFAEERAWALSMRHLVFEKPESFDPENRDDCAALRLMPVMIKEDGTRASTEEIMAKVEPDSVKYVTHKHGDKATVEIIADGEDETMSTSMEVDLIEPSPESDFVVPVVQRVHSDPDNTAIENIIQQLKSKVLDEKDFRVSFAFYMDECAENEKFVSKGKVVNKAPRMKTALQQLSKEVSPGSKHRISQIKLNHLRRHDFLHGTAKMDGKSVIVFFFQDLGFGMAAIDAGFGSVHYSRLTLAAVRGSS